MMKNVERSACMLARTCVSARPRPAPMVDSSVDAARATSPGTGEDRPPEAVRRGLREARRPRGSTTCGEPGALRALPGDVVGAFEVGQRHRHDAADAGHQVRAQVRDRALALLAG